MKNRMEIQIAFAIFGLVLTFAGILKIRSAGLQAPVVEWVPYLQILFAVFELFVGVWFLQVSSSRFSLLFALFLFAGFLAFQIVNFKNGMGFYCQCMGGFKVQKWKMLVFDLTIVAWISWLIARNWRELAIWPPHFSRSLVISSCSATILLLIASLLVFGESRLGERLVFQTELESLRPDEFSAVAIRVWNPSSSPIRILGFQKSCALKASDDLPIAVPPREVKTIPFEAKGGPPGKQTIIPMTLFTDQRDSFIVNVELSGKTAL